MRPAQKTATGVRLPRQARASRRACEARADHRHQARQEVGEERVLVERPLRQPLTAADGEGPDPVGILVDPRKAAVGVGGELPDVGEAQDEATSPMAMAKGRSTTTDFHGSGTDKG